MVVEMAGLSVKFDTGMDDGRTLEDLLGSPEALFEAFMDACGGED